METIGRGAMGRQPAMAVMVETPGRELWGDSRRETAVGKGVNQDNLWIETMEPVPMDSLQFGSKPWDLSPWTAAKGSCHRDFPSIFS